MVEIRANKYEKEIAVYGRFMESDEESAKLLSNIVLGIIVKTNYFITACKRFEDVTMDYCEKNIKDKLYEDIKEYIKRNSLFNLDGYVIFRAKEYREQVDKFLNSVLIKMVVKDKHDRLIGELRNYVACSKPSRELIYLDNTKGYYEIFDEAHNLLTREVIYSYAREHGIEDQMMGTDIVMNFLLKTLPKKILIHIKGGTPNTFIKTLNLVFGDRILEFNGY